jgi:dynein heavy chain, axonemal
VATGGRGGGATVAAAPAPKKKLFLTDGWNVALTGVCVYMFRLNISKQLPEEGFHKVFI